MKNFKMVMSMLLIIILTIGVFPNNINKVEAKVTDIFLSSENIYLAKGNTSFIYLAYNDDNNKRFYVSINNKKIKWTSSNKKIATVNKNGVITSKKNGTVKITAKYKNKKYICKVYVTNKKLLYEDKFVKIYFKELSDVKMEARTKPRNGFLFVQAYNKTNNQFSIKSSNFTINKKMIKISDGIYNKGILPNDTNELFFTIKNFKTISIGKISSSMYLTDSENNVIDYINFSNIKIR